MRIRIDFCDPHRLLQSPDQSGLQARNNNALGIDPGRLRCAFDVPRQTLVAHTPDQVKPVLDAVAACARQGLWCVGYLRYEAASAFDKAFVTHKSDGPLAWFGVFDQALAWLDDDPTQGLTDAATCVQWHGTLSRTGFDARMSDIHQAIAAGEFYQVNYTAPLAGELIGNAASLFERLQRAQPGGYAALIDTGFEQVLSVSPELFFDWQPGLAGQSGHILTRPMKGTAPRGSNAAQDQALAQALVTSPKERAENVMIVDLLRNDLSRIAQPHSVKVPSLFQVQTLPTVLQMVSDVTASTRPGISLTDVFGALFPCGSITGAPKVRAMQMIRDLEPEPRGIYCGAIGVVRPGGHATFNVAIRTVTLRGPAAVCGIGSGITADATADAEWQEWQVKRGFLDRASIGFELLETLRLDHGIYINLIAHIARLERAARHFSYPFDETHVHGVLQTLAFSCGANPALCTTTIWRVRLRLDSSGQACAQAFALTPVPAPVTLQLASTPFEAAHSEFTCFKTTRRAHYEAFAPSDPAVFDTLLFNPSGELTECTRGNIALQLDGRWVTPPLRCGLLDGVGRETYLKDGRLLESVVRVDDLPRVQTLAFVNSLRGWVDARLIGV